MKNLSIESFNAFERSNGVKMFAIKTSQGIVYATKDYVSKKAANIGRSVNDILSNADMYVIKAEEVVLRKEGEAFEYTDKEGKKQTTTPKSDYLEVSSFDLTLTQDGSLNRLIAINVASQIANSISGAFNDLGQPKSLNTQSSDSGDDIAEELVIKNEEEAN